MIERLTKDTPENPERIGGKGCGLVRLIRAGFPVPEAWILPGQRMGSSDPNACRLDEKARRALEAFWETFQKAFPGARLA